MIKVPCTIGGEPLADIPKNINYKFQKGLELFCFESYTDGLQRQAIELPEDAEVAAINKAIEKKKAKVSFGLSCIDWYDGFMDSKRFDDQLRPARKAIKVILKPIYSELTDGNLRDAIDEIKLLTNANFDGVFIRKSAMLKLRNKIEEFLGRPLATAYNE